MPCFSHFFKVISSSLPLGAFTISAIITCAPIANAAPTPTQSPSPAATPTPEPTPDPATEKVEAVKAANREAERAMSVAERLQLAASRKTGVLDDRCKQTTIGDQTLIEFRQITEETIAATEPNLVAALTDSDVKVKAAETKLKAARDALPTAEPLSADVIDARNAAEATLGNITNRLKSLNEEKANLTLSLQRGFTCAQGLVSSMSEKIAPLNALAPNAPGDEVLPVLNRSASDLTQVINFNQRVSALWGANQSTGGLMAALSALGTSEAELKTVTDGLATIDAEVKGIGGKLKTWLISLSAYEKSRRAKLAELSQQVVVNPAMFADRGQSEVKAGTRLTANVSQLNAMVGLLEPQLSNVLSATDSQALSDAAEELVEETRRFGVAVTQLQDALGGSFEDFEADQVSLFYFTDVRRLMYALNPATFEMGGEADARERAAQARRDLVEAELALREARGRVSDQQRRLEALREEQRQAHAQFLASDSLLTTHGRKLDELKSRPDKDDRRIAESELRKADLQAERDAAKERDEELSNEQSGLPAQIREAQNDLVKAQERVRTSRNNMVRFALVESEAFARARENAPFLVAMPLASSTDPAKRVLLYAFADSRTIFLRGNPADLDKVSDIIARFDRPAPQARMTLWSLELNSTADKDGARRFNEALESIEGELANTRARIATSLSFLRDCINEEVNRVALLKLEELRRERVANGNLSATPQDQADLLWARLHFYQPEVLFRLGFEKDSEPRSSFSVARYTLPDPAATTTLGEALMILNLAKLDSRWAIANKFRDKLKERLDALGLADTLTDKQKKNNSDPHNLREPSRRFAFLRRAMGLDLDPVAPYVLSTSPRVVLDKDFAFNSTQQEIVRAIEADAVGKVLDRFRSLQAELDQLQKEIDDAETEEEVNRGERRRRNLVTQILPLIAWLKNEIGMNITGNFRSPEAAVGITSLRTKTSSAVQQNAAAVETLATVVRDLNPSRRATARVAAADQMLKELIIAFEDDVDRHFVQPMMLRLRDGLVQQYKGIGVGIIQRTSVLATNRGLARVDASGSAQLALGEETDILAGVQQLANLYLAGQTGNALSILGGLNALPRKDSSELYGLTTGGVFKVTPIFDPSGQALRFQFDHVSGTMVREPDGTVNPQLPRVERHTVNTEVQLSNMELREISRFNANARLGIPTRTWGGLPIFNSIPWIRRNIPLIGWFVKKKGDAPFVQQSVIFGQTTMYPTIGDLMDLLRNTEAPTNENPKEQAPSEQPQP